MLTTAKYQISSDFQNNINENNFYIFLCTLSKKLILFLQLYKGLKLLESYLNLILVIT